MRLLAGTYLALEIICVLSQPFLIGKPREPITANLWLFNTLLNLGFAVPICGRVIGWW